jgi:hypothetical protein
MRLVIPTRDPISLATSTRRELARNEMAGHPNESTMRPREERDMRKMSAILLMFLMLGVSVIRPDVVHSQSERVEKQLQEVQQLKEKPVQTVQPREVDLMCKIDVVNVGGFKFKYKVKVKNKGMKTLNQVLFNWLVTRDGTMVEQDGAGFGLMYPNTWYTGDVGPFMGTADSYQIEVFVDPDNAQGEPQGSRGDNNCSK